PQRISRDRPAFAEIGWKGVCILFADLDLDHTALFVARPHRPLLSRRRIARRVADIKAMLLGGNREAQHDGSIHLRSDLPPAQLPDRGTFVSESRRCQRFGPEGAPPGRLGTTPTAVEKVGEPRPCALLIRTLENVVPNARKKRAPQTRDVRILRSVCRLL